MVTLLEGGAYLLNGTEIIPDNQEAAPGAETHHFPPLFRSRTDEGDQSG